MGAKSNGDIFAACGNTGGIFMKLCCDKSVPMSVLQVVILTLFVWFQ